MNKILVLSNDPVFKQKNIEVLAEGGFQVADAPDALDGLLMIDKNGFDIIVIDEELSGIDGYWACKKIRQYSEIPIILLGAEPAEEIWAKANEFGFDVYLKKPIGPRELMAHIKAILRRTRGEEEIEPSREEKLAEVEPAPAAPLPEVEPVRLEETVEPEKPVGVQPRKIICSNCKSDNPAGQKFCGTCGAKLTDETQPTLVTPLPETGPVRLQRGFGPEKPSERETPAAMPVAPVTPLPETKPVRLERAAEPVVTQPQPVKVGKPVQTQATPVTPLPETGPARLEKAMVPKITQPQLAVKAPSSVGNIGFGAWEDARVTRLFDALAIGKIAEIDPVIDISVKGGFTYPALDKLVGTSGEGSVHILEALVRDNILDRKPFEKLHVDPEGSLQLVPVERCPNCGSGNLIKGQLIEHFNCGNVALDQDYTSDHKYVCPKCKKELKLLGTDYRYAGTQYRCSDSGDTFPTPVTKWRSLRTGKIWATEELQEVWLYSYSLSPDKRDWLEFQLKPKAQLVDFLRHQGYQVEELAEIHGASGAVHTIDILATRDDGLAKFHLGIGILSALPGEKEVRLEELFKFDTAAYDTGINYKVVMAIHKLSPEAMKFAERQKIGVFDASDPEALTSLFSSQPHTSPAVLTRAKARYLSELGAQSGPQAQLTEFLRYRGYEVFEKAKVPGKSGAEHIFDIFAQRDDVIVKPTIAVAIATADEGQAVGVGKVAQFDAEAFDAGIRNKVFVAIPQTIPEAKQFARQQRIRVLDEHELEGLIRSSAAA